MIALPAPHRFPHPLYLAQSTPSSKAGAEAKKNKIKENPSQTASNSTLKNQDFERTWESKTFWHACMPCC